MMHGNAGTHSVLPHAPTPFHRPPACLQADGTPNMLMLNDVAEALGVPRRRLYDVINVFESIEASLCRTCVCFTLPACVSCIACLSLCCPRSQAARRGGRLASRPFGGGRQQLPVLRAAGASAPRDPAPSAGASRHANRPLPPFHAPLPFCPRRSCAAWAS